MPGIYRQTTEVSGTFKTYISPSKKCTSKKVSPSHPIPKHKRVESEHFISPYTNEEPELIYNQQYYASVHSQPLVRPYTPPEKRYSSSFGHRIPERKYNASKSKHAQYIYENINAERDFCVGDECYINQTRNEQRNVRNVKVNNFPLPEFNQMYIQENFE